MVVLLALGAAASYGLASALQHQATPQHGHGMLSGAGMVALLRHPRWLLGNLFDLVGYALQVLALRTGALVLVEPLLVTQLIFAFPVGDLLAHRRISRSELSAAALVTGGLALFLSVGRPETSPGRPSSIALWFLTGATALVIGGCVAGARLRRRGFAGLLLAVAAGTSFGYMAAMTSLTWSVISSGGFVHALGSWELYALGVSGAIGLVLTPNAFNAGRLALTLPTLTVAQPLVAIGIGLAVFDEKLATAGLAPLWESLGLLLSFLGVYALARRAMARED